MSHGHVDILLPMYKGIKLIERVLLSQTLFTMPKSLAFLGFFASLRLTSAAKIVLVELYSYLGKRAFMNKKIGLEGYQMPLSMRKACLIWAG